MPTPTLIHTIGLQSACTTLLFSPSIHSLPPRYLLYTALKSIFIHNLATHTKVVELKEHAWDIKTLDITMEADKLASAGRGSECKIWDVKTGKGERKINAHEHKITTVKFHSNSQILATGSFDTAVKLWDLRTNNTKPIQILEQAQDSITTITFDEEKVDYL
jgi:mitogen-activated protein kinase organizer 1